MKRLFAVFLGLVGISVHAAMLTWDADPATPAAQDGSGTWDTVATNWWDGAANTNWTSATPDDAVLGAGGTPGTITLAGPVSIGSLTFASVLSGGYVVTGGTITLAGPSAVTSVAPATIASVLAGGGLEKNGAGVLTLSASNTFSGGATIKAGQLALGDDAALGVGTITLAGGSLARNVANAAITNAIVISSGGAIAGRLVVDNYVRFTGPLSGSGPLTVSGLVALASAANTYGGTVTLSGANAYLKLEVNNALSNNIVNLAASTYLTLTAGTTSTVGAVNGAGGNIFNQSVAPATLIVGGDNRSGGYTGTVANGGGPMHLTKIGTGTQVLSGTSALWSGTVTVNGGTLRSTAGNIGGATALGLTNQIVVNGPGRLDIGGVNGTANQIGVSEFNTVTVNGGTLNFSFTGASGQDGAYMGTINLNGATVTGATNSGPRFGYTHGSGVINATGTASTWSAPIWLVNQSGVSMTINAATNLTFSGVIADYPGIGGLPFIKTGAGALTVSATNTYSGTTTIAQGTILVRTSNALGSAGSAVTLGSTNTGANNVELSSGNTAGDLVFRRNITVTTNGTGTATVGGRHTGGRAFFDGVLTINRDTLLLAAGADRTMFRGGIAGTGSVTIAGGGRVTWSSTTGGTEYGNGASAYTFAGGITIAGTGTILQLNSDFIAGSQSLGGKSLNIVTGGVLRMPYDVDATFDALNGNGTVEAFAPGGGAAGNVFTVGAGGGSGTFAGPLINTGGATLLLVKSGAGVQTLTAVNTYSGSTTIQTGTLALAGSGAISNSPLITVSSGAVFDVSAGSFALASGKTLQGQGAVTGTFTAASGSRVAPGGTNTVGAFTFNGSLVCEAGATNFFELGPDATGVNDRIVVNGDLAPGGSAIQIAPVSQLSTGTYTLFTYTGFLAGSFDPILRGAPQLRQTLTLDETVPQQVNLVVSGAPAGLIWAATAATNWDVATSTNWVNTGTLLEDYFFQSDSVLFGDTSGVATAISIDATVQPGAMTVAADTNAYVFTGPGRIAGSLTLNKSGASTLTLGTTNTYAGATIISNGTVVAAANGAFGASSVMLAGGVTLARSGGTTALGNPLALAGGVVTLDDAGGTLTLTNVVSGDGALVKAGTGTVTVSGANTFTGGTRIAAGTVNLGHVAALGTGPALVSTNAVLNLGAFAAANPVTLDGGTLGLNGGVTYATPVTLAAGAVNTLRPAGNYALLNGAIGGPGGFVLGGTGFPGLQLANPANSFLGNIDIQPGAFLRLTASEVIPDTATVNIQSNANLRLEGGGLTETVAGLTGRGQVWIPTIGNQHTLRVGAGDATSVFDGQIGPSGQNLTITLQKIGSGSFTVNATNLYVGPTHVSNGAFVVNGLKAGTGEVFVAAGATLGGTGVVHGAVTSSGTVAPGASAGLLTLASNYSESAGSVLQIELGGTTAGSGHDQLIVSNAATLTGTLAVTLINGFMPATNDVFLILDAATVSGTFSSLSLPALAAGQGWEVQYLPGEVFLTITNASLTGPSGYDLAATAITNGLTGYQDDADGDGYANLLEYVTGGSLTNVDTTARMNGTRTNNVLALKFFRDTAATDATIYVEGSYAATNGADWVGIATNLAGSWGTSTNVTESGASPVNVTVQDTEAIATNRFLRLRVTRP